MFLTEELAEDIFSNRKTTYFYFSETVKEEDGEENENKLAMS